MSRCPTKRQWRRCGELVAVLSIFSALLEAPVRGADGAPDYVLSIRSVEEFDLVSAPPRFPSDETERTTKYLLPAAGEPGLLPPVFQNVNLYEGHYTFLVEVFPERFAGLSRDGYRQLAEHRATRKYFVGSLSRLRTAEGRIYGFDVFADDGDPDELLTVAEVRAVYDDLLAVMDLRPLVYAPTSSLAQLAAKDWQDPGFGVYLGGVVSGRFQSYTRGVGYGRVKILSLAELDDLSRAGRITWQDVLVLEQAPRDLDGVVQGVITAEPQGAFSHVAVRTARRGTPNAFVADAANELRGFSGKLVRLEVCSSDYAIEETSLEEAEGWWAESRPQLSFRAEADEGFRDLASLDAIDVDAEQPSPEARFGGKATNMARLSGILDGERARYREVGFVVPVAYYFDFMRSGRINSPTDAGRYVSYEEYLEELFDLPSFQGDPEFRFAALRHLQEHMEDESAVPEELVERVAARVEEVFGWTDRPVRCRSSSNAEDALEFNGAGLYESTSACAADDRDGDESGPSLCDAEEPSERGIARALKRVWASLWNFRAYEERSWYGIAQEDVAMAVLVTRAFRDEISNGVAFTGNPAKPGDRRYVVTAQKGDASVVSPDPGVLPETNVLEMAGGEVSRILRLARSSLVEEGEVVMSDEQLDELGALLGHVDANMPVELGTHAREDVLWDVEFKIESTGELAVKQVRPFLVNEPARETPTFVLDVPESSVACGVFVDGRSPRGEYLAKSQLFFRPGRYELPTRDARFERDLIRSVVVGPGEDPASPVGPGIFSLGDGATCRGESTYTFSYEQLFSLPGGESFRVLIEFLQFRPGDGGVRSVDEELLTDGIVMVGIPGGDQERLVRYSSCGYERLPRWQIRARFDDATEIELEERFRPPRAGSGPANLVAARATLGGVERATADYWSLVYSAQHHNVQVRYWVVLDPPVVLGGVGEVGAIEIDEPRPDAGRPAEASYLSPRLEVLARPVVTDYFKALWEGEFRRGDTDGDEIVTVTDAVRIARALYQGGAALTCPDAADFDDDGAVEVTDAVLILRYLFSGIDLSQPPGTLECGVDPTEDFLGGCQSACP